MLLCDVALGRIDKKNLYSYSSSDFDGKKHDSIEAIGGKIPDPLGTLRYQGGFEIPLGDHVDNDDEKARGRGHYYYQQATEYVTFKDNQTALRYLVQIEDPNM